jgi:hypothetical protein
MLDKLGVASLEEKLVQHQLRWFRYVQHRPLETPMCSWILRDSNERGMGRTNLIYELE